MSVRCADSEAAVVRLFDELRESTADAAGVTRESYGAGESLAHERVARFAEAAGLRVERDAAANLVVSLPGFDEDAPVVACGSHLDSVPCGGNFDGAAGVLAGLLALSTLRRRARTPRRSLRLYAFRGEESAWFGQCYLGSSALFGGLGEEDLRRPGRDGGKTLGEAMAACGADTARIARGERLIDPATFSSYVELHIEQGPVLERNACPVGLVTGIRGNRRYRACCLGEAGHSGTTPRELRRDAAFGFADFVSRVDERWRTLEAEGVDLVVTVGTCATDPERHAVSRIPDEVRFSLEARSIGTDGLDRFEAEARAVAAEVEAERGVRVTLDEVAASAPAAMAPGIRSQLARLCVRSKIPYLELPSGAGHDAAVFAGADVPSGMIFVRNQHGSHNPREAMRTDDFVLGATLLREFLYERAIAAPGQPDEASGSRTLLRAAPRRRREAEA